MMGYILWLETRKLEFFDFGKLIDYMDGKASM